MNVDRRRFLAGAVAALGVSACGGSSRRLHLGTNQWIGYEPWYVGRDRQLLPPDLDLVECVSASQVLRTLANGRLDFGALTLDEAVRGLGLGMDLRVIAVLDVSFGGDGIVGRPDVASFAALAGRRVGVEHTATGAYVLARACAIHGVDPASLQVVYLQPHEHLPAFQSGAVDALVTFQPILRHALDSGGHSLFDSRAIPGEVVDVLVAQRGVPRPDQQRVVDHWFACRDVVVGELAADGAPVSARYRSDTPAACAAMYASLQFPDRALSDEMIGGESATLLPVARRLHRTLSDFGYAPPELRIEELFDRVGP